VANAIIGWKG